MEHRRAIPLLSNHHISESCGFLLPNPLVRLPEEFEAWNFLAENLEDLLLKHELRRRVDEMSLCDHRRLTGHRQQRLAYTFLCFIGNGYIWQEGDACAAKVVPKQLAIPWCAVSEALGLRPAASHAGCVLSNYKLINPNGNITTLVRFPGGKHCDWFFMVTAQVELTAVKGLKAIITAMHGVVEDDIEVTTKALRHLRESIREMKEVFSRMHDGLDADVFYNTMRPFLSGWGGEGSALPEGVIYEGVSSEPVQVTGGSAAQSSPIMAFDAALGVQHGGKPSDFLAKMRQYMPPAHRDFIAAVENGPSIRAYVKEREENAKLNAVYHDCVHAMKDFRSYHIQIVVKYVVVMSNRRKASFSYEGVAERGTGGQAFMPFLKSLRDSTSCE
ncbi:hypothetical protein CAPTEDRAFT_200823 [Capitella teleta]|uniref:Indoleamine 2,3-dioxygenase n=1 Tax=Capitella teleta TaxID=283909 RepID=R7UV45_CAPTE|nr:hypothetical protein CAPTEDRAFT_200823 [Capitella teleta]|eukprot:ELU10508.1 hypothetical protein CAPTEDRAFT_200823 [Capitella teleta]